MNCTKVEAKCLRVRESAHFLTLGRHSWNYRLLRVMGFTLVDRMTLTSIQFHLGVS